MDDCAFEELSATTWLRVMRGRTLFISGDSLSRQSAFALRMLLRPYEKEHLEKTSSSKGNHTSGKNTKETRDIFSPQYKDFVVDLGNRWCTKYKYDFVLCAALKADGEGSMGTIELNVADAVKSGLLTRYDVAFLNTGAWQPEHMAGYAENSSQTGGMAHQPPDVKIAKAEHTTRQLVKLYQGSGPVPSERLPFLVFRETAAAHFPTVDGGHVREGSKKKDFPSFDQHWWHNASAAPKQACPPLRIADVFNGLNEACNPILEAANLTVLRIWQSTAQAPSHHVIARLNHPKLDCRHFCLNGASAVDFWIEMLLTMLGSPIGRARLDWHARSLGPRQPAVVERTIEQRWESARTYLLGYRRRLSPPSPERAEMWEATSSSVSEEWRRSRREQE